MEALAELAIYHSRPFAPTRRLALAPSRLPVDPAPGPGGVLLGGIVAHHRDELDEESAQGFLRLTLQLQEGQRIIQPRLRHRFQDDRHGLTRSRARLLRDDGGLTVQLENKGTGLQLMLGAVYTAGRMDPGPRRAVMDAIRKGLRWTGPLDRRLYAHLSGRDGSREWTPDVYEDPVRWAMRVLGMDRSPAAGDHHADADLPDRRAVQRSFREALRAAHPDHGGASAGAAQRINDLTEARRILLP